MGSGIATVLILSNVSVVLKEINHEYLQKGMKTIEGWSLVCNSLSQSVNLLRCELADAW